MSHYFPFVYSIQSEKVLGSKIYVWNSIFVADLLMVRRINVNSTNRKFIVFFITLSKWQIKIQRKGYENLDIIKKAAVVKKLEKETLDITTDDSLLEKKGS